MGSYCIHGAVKQHLRWAGICSSLPEQLWWQLHHAGCGLLFSPLPGAEGARGSAPCAGVWAPPPQPAGGGQDVPGAPRWLSLTFADLLLPLHSLLWFCFPTPVRGGGARSEPLPAAVSGGPGAGAGVPHCSMGCLAAAVTASTCQAPAGDRPEATQHRCPRSAGSSVSRCVPSLFAEHRQPMHMAGLFVYTHTCLWKCKHTCL